MTTTNDHMKLLPHRHFYLQNNFADYHLDNGIITLPIKSDKLKDMSTP